MFLHNELPHAYFIKWVINMSEEQSFSILKTRNELADYLCVPRKKLTYILYIKEIDNCYTSFEIPKKNGELRNINTPIATLKHFQRNLVNRLEQQQALMLEKTKTTLNISHGFVKGKTIFTNAQIHKNKRYVLNLDLENFFDCFHFGRVQGYFMKNKQFQLPYEVATVIAQLTCYQGKLPQGAPSSPIITNLISQILDRRILKIARKFKLDYTRYADDLTFSTNKKDFTDELEAFLQEIELEIVASGFSINNKKTRIQYKDSQQRVTGLVVNKKINVTRDYYKQTRAMAHSLYKNGMYTVNGVEGTLNQLEGRFSFIRQVAKKTNDSVENGDHDFENLNGNEKQYQKLLFYKYFYANSQPLIVTEGKTDPLYIKAALKKLHSKYPDLVTKLSNDKYGFNVSFLKRNKKNKNYFNINIDGGIELQKVYFYYSDAVKSFRNLFSYFKRICKDKPEFPVILLYDNELSRSNKGNKGNQSKKDAPVNSLLKNIKCNSQEKEEYKNKLKENNFINIKETNLYVMVIPLRKNKEECEIEDLFNETPIINNRSFSKTDENIEKFYNKDILSKYVIQNYNNIDFSGFRNLLDTINKIIIDYKKSTIAENESNN
jgi:hypothetical protein